MMSQNLMRIITLYQKKKTVNNGIASEILLRIPKFQVSITAAIYCIVFIIKFP